MKKYISLLFGLSLLTNVCIAGDWTEKYTPTKAEWLQQALERDIETTTDRWRNRVSLNVIVFAKDKAVMIFIAPADGQPELTTKMCYEYSLTVEGIAKLTLEKYSWSTSGKIQSKCV